jgi:dihydrofolate reductase
VAELLYSAITSLDGMVVDADGRFDWARPDEELHAVVNDQERSVGTYLYGRRMYEVMVAWETMQAAPGQQDAAADYSGIWQAADKVVYSTTLPAVSSARTRMERVFDPDAVRRLKAAADQDLSVGGPGLAAAAFRAGLVDQVDLFIHPVVVGGGTPALPTGVRLDLELAGERRIGSGVVHLRYRIGG